MNLTLLACVFSLSAATLPRAGDPAEALRGFPPHGFVWEPETALISAAGGECGGKSLSVWRRNADGTHELVTETGLLQAQR